MPNPFTYPAYDLLDARILDTLPYAGVSFGAPLNQPGSWAGGLPLASQQVQSFDWERATSPGNTALFVDFAGQLIWGGILWTQPDYSSADPTHTLKVGATEFPSYFQQRLQAEDYTSTWAAGADPMLIAQQVIEDALAKGSIMGGITVTLNPAGGEAGPQITPSYPGTSLQTVDSIVSILTQMGYTVGFDYSIDVAYLAGTKTPGLTLNFWYPRKGRTAAQSRLTLLSKDCTFTYPVDATQTANDITETGSGTGTMTPVRASHVVEDYPLLERTFARSQINDDGTLAQVTASDLFNYVYPVVTPTFTVPVWLPDPVTGLVDPRAPLQFGTFDRGDDFLFRIDPVAGGGNNTNPRFRNGYSFEWRINSWQCTVADKGLSQIVLSAGVPPGVFPPPRPPI
jgi:hypothetical protein